MLADAFGGGVHQFAGNRVALLRHGAACATTFDEGFVHFAQLAGHHHHHIQGDFAEGASDQAEEIQGFSQAVPSNVPSRLWHAQAQFSHQGLLDFQAFVA
ncbi:hypothetical protein D3C76_1601580 [compost metagenome]